MIVEFIGGPWDGEIREITETPDDKPPTVFRVPLTTGPALTPTEDYKEVHYTLRRLVGRWVYTAPGATPAHDPARRWLAEHCPNGTDPAAWVVAPVAHSEDAEEPGRSIIERKLANEVRHAVEGVDGVAYAWLPPSEVPAAVYSNRGVAPDLVCVAVAYRSLRGRGEGARRDDR